MRLIRFFLLGGSLLSGGLHAQEHQDLGKFTDYAESSEVWLASILGQVKVNPKVLIEVSMNGELTWKVTDGQRVEVQDVLCLTNAKKISLSERGLQLKKTRYANSLLDLEVGSRERKNSAMLEIQEKEEKLARLMLTPGERSLLGDEFAKRLAKERKEFEKGIEELRSKLAGDYFEKELSADKESLNIELDSAQVDHDQLLKMSEVRAAVAGEISILYRDEVKELTTIGHVVQSGIAEVSVEVSDYRLSSVPSAELSIEVSGDDGILYKGSYLRTSTEKQQRMNAKLLVFQLQKQNPETPIPEGLNGSRMIRVLRILPKPGRVVQKGELVSRFPKEIGQFGWAPFFEKRWAGVKVSYIGPKVVVLNLANEN